VLPVIRDGSAADASPRMGHMDCPRGPALGSLAVIRQDYGMNPALVAIRRPLVVALGFLAAGLFAADPARKPNVLFIMVDDLRPELGAYGVEGIKTPHIDALAARSVRFDRAICQFPLCNPGRTSLLTGRYPTQTGVWDNRQSWRRLNPGWKTLPRWFRDHGYATLRAGKIFHAGIDDTEAWVEGGEARRFPDDASERIDGRDRDPNVKQPGETGNRASGSDKFEVYPGNGETNGDYVNATRTIELMKRYAAGSQPFFMACGFSKPHSPPGAPQKFYDLYDLDRIPLPPDFAAKPTVPAGFPELSVVPRNTDLFIGREGDAAKAREMKRAYWASTSFMDSNVGRVMAALDELGLRENTIVVFWGDHGYHLGEKGRWSKAYSLWDIANRTPFMIAAPGLTPKNGGVCERTVEVINTYRTLTDLCGLPDPAADVAGVSLRPLLRDPAARWDRPAFTMMQYRGHVGRSVTTDRWHYVEWDEGQAGRMLLDRANDPRELKNLSEEPAHAERAAELRAQFAKVPAWEMAGR
jgi:iduronate 2-sulfatase